MNTEQQSPVSKFTRGSFWRTRGGWKAEILISDRKHDAFPIVVLHHNNAATISSHCDTCEEYNGEVESSNDLLTPWVDKPVVNWAAMPAWAKAVWWSPGWECWFWSSKVPIKGDIGFDEYETQGGIPEPHCPPPWTGDWKDSLVERPM